MYESSAIRGQWDTENRLFWCLYSPGSVVILTMAQDRCRGLTEPILLHPLEGNASVLHWWDELNYYCSLGYGSAKLIAKLRVNKATDFPCNKEIICIIPVIISRVWLLWVLEADANTDTNTCGLKLPAASIQYFKFDYFYAPKFLQNLNEQRFPPELYFWQGGKASETVFKPSWDTKTQLRPRLMKFL